MKSTVEPVEGNKVKLSIEVDSEAFEREVDAAFKRIAREVRIPGFRPGKAPRKLLEARIGAGAARGDALEHALPKYYSDAVEEHEVDVIASPEIEITAGQDGGDLAFDAVVEVRPTVHPAGYASLRITIDSPEVSDDDVEAQVDRLREGFAQLEVVDRPVQSGDHVTIDVVGARDGEPIDGLVADDYLYEVGSGTVVPELDEQLEAAKAGAVLEFTAEHPDEDEDPVEFTVTVKEVKEKVLPEAEDEFANEASEFESIEDLRADLREKLAGFKRSQSEMQIRQNTADALAELVTEDVPDAMVDNEFRSRLQDLQMRLQGQGFSIDDYVASLGDGAEGFIADMREAASRGVKVDLALRAVADAEEIVIDDDDLDEEFASVAERIGSTSAKVRKDFERGGQVSAVRSDLRNRRALEWLIERVELVDEGGNPIDRASLEAAPDAEEDATEDTE